MNSSTKVKGKCLCGAVVINCSTLSDNFGACHCKMCRTWSGGPALAFEGSDISYENEENIAIYSSSDWAERGFCRKCGTHIFYRLKNGEFNNFPLGLFEGVDHLKFNLQIFTDKKPLNYCFANKTEMMTEAEVFAKFMPT